MGVYYTLCLNYIDLFHLSIRTGKNPEYFHNVSAFLDLNDGRRRSYCEKKNSTKDTN